MEFRALTDYPILKGEEDNGELKEVIDWIVRDFGDTKSALEWNFVGEIF